MNESVEAMLRGSAGRFTDMLPWLTDGMVDALFEGIEVAKLKPPFARFDSFEQMPSLRAASAHVNDLRDWPP